MITLSDPIEASRCYHLLLAQNDESMRQLEEQIATMPILEFIKRKKAIEDARKTIKAMYEPR